MGRQIGHDQTMLVKNRRQKRHGVSCPISNEMPVMLDLLDFSDWQPAESRELSRVDAWYHLLLLMVLGSMPPYPGAFVSLSGFIFLSSNSRLMSCRENAGGS